MKQAGEMKRVAVLMGGPSSEREVSIATGTGVLQALQSLGYQAEAFDFDHRVVEALRTFGPDVVFNALHGVGGEDGQAQAILEWMGLPYTGTGIQGCAMSMDKHITKKLLAAEGLPTPAWDVFDLSGGTLPLLPGLNLPLVVKPVDEGSSVGVAIVRTHDQWKEAMIAYSERYDRVLVEEYVAGREFSVPVLFEDVLPVVEIVAEDSFYSYEAKYKPGGSRHLVPAPLDEDLTARLQVLALSTHRLLNLRDYSRTDILLSREGRPYILEVNTLPGLTPTSILPDSARSMGIAYETLVDRLVRAAYDRHPSKEGTSSGRRVSAHLRRTVP
ncbi:MAG TPA: D-alanine--D-alanine ligase [Candidatus Dormibacteraeota bacterium]|nr:D-alanine--D-alanine ligase [Candidatus Dormibacteraeota bacterium]